MALPPAAKGESMGHAWSLRTRFLLIATACLLPLVGVTAFVLYQSLSYGREQLQDAQASTAEVVAQVLAATLDDNERMLGELANSDRIRKLEMPGAGEVLDQFKRARGNLYGLFLIGPEGNLVSFTGLDPTPFQGDSTFEASEERALKLGEPGVSNRLMTPDASMIAVIAPVHAKDQEDGLPVGAVGALLSVDWLKDTVLPFARGNTVIAVIAEGEVIAAQGGGMDDAELTASIAAPAQRAIAGAVGEESYTDANGQEHLAAFNPVPGANWAVLVSHPSPAAYGPNRALFERGMIALGVAGLATLALALLLGEWISRPLRQLTGQATALMQGDFTPRPAPGGSGELIELGNVFQELTGQISAQVTALEAAREAGDAQAAQMRELNRRTIRLQVDERGRIAGDIHDAVAPLITGALYQVRALQLASGGNGRHDGDGHRAEELGEINLLLERSMDELHNVIFSLRPPDLDDIGVVAAIERYMAQVQRSGLNCRMETTGEPPSLTPEVRLAIYRIVQEALHNALRHAAADEAVVKISSTNDHLRVVIHDNGAGFNIEAAARPAALGLLSMRERAAAIGATFAIASRPGDGTTIVIEREMEPAPPVEVDVLALQPDYPEPQPLALAGKGDER